MKTGRLLACAAVAALAMWGVARAADVTTGALPTRATTIALFKNGLAFVVREGELPRGREKRRVAGLPAPVHGTFWAWSPGKPDAVKSMVASMEDRAESSPVQSLHEMLRANVGRSVDLVVRDGADVQTVRGKILPVPAAPPPVIGITRDYLPSPVPSLVLIGTSNGTVALDPGSIARASFEGSPVLELQRPGRSAALSIDAEGAAPLTLAYLARGATWSPSYAVELLGTDRARVTAKAEIVNELEDLADVRIQLVTGYPNVAFADVEDPIAMRGDLASFLAALGGAAGTAGGRGVVMNQLASADEFRRERYDAGPAYSTSPPAGERREELFFYPLEHVTLKKGERAYLPLFSQDAAAEHRYEVDLDDRVQDDRYTSPTYGGGRKPPLDVWHRVRLTNGGKQPWTTGPAMATRDGAFLAQDVLEYAPPGGSTTLPITKALDLRAQADEFEVERKQAALRAYGYTYDEITARGVVELRSHRDTDVTVTITKRLTGEVLGTTPAGKVQLLTRELRAVNPNASITWSLPLKAGGKVNVEYRYKVLVRE